jgi:hypothetical protein
MVENNVGGFPVTYFLWFILLLIAYKNNRYLFIVIKNLKGFIQVKGLIDLILEDIDNWIITVSDSAGRRNETKIWEPEFWS